MVKDRSVRRHGEARVRARLMCSTALSPAVRCALSAGLISTALLTAPAALAQGLVGDSFGGRGGSTAAGGGAGGGPDQPGQAGSVQPLPAGSPFVVFLRTFGVNGAADEAGGGGGGGPSSSNVPQPGGPGGGNSSAGGAGGAGGIAGFGSASGAFGSGTSYTGTNGAAGQQSFNNNPGGPQIDDGQPASGSGGGGAGGYGAILAGSGAFGTTANITGGRGGNGGSSEYGYGGGYGYGLLTPAGAGGGGGVGLRIRGETGFAVGAGASIRGGDGGNGGGLTAEQALARNGRVNNDRFDRNTFATIAGGAGGAGGSALSSNSSQSFVNGGQLQGGAGGAGSAGQTLTQDNVVVPPEPNGNGGSGGSGALFLGSGRLTNSGAIAGGAGGAGGIGILVQLRSDSGPILERSPNGAGGLGGAGGFGAAFAADGTATNSGAITGGAGGAGGAGSSTAYPGGAGGAGGDGVYALAGLTLTNTGTITGGNGGAGGSRSLAYAGADGAGGAGVRGAGLLIDNRGGTISGGLAPDGLARSPALVLTGGSNQISGGTLVGGISVEGTATFQPALNTAAVGTPLAVTGPISFAPGSTYQIRITPTASDSVVATGAATLAGASVSVLAGQATYAPSTRYTILTAAGGLAGRFGTVFTNLAFLTPTLSYDANTVFLNVTSTATPTPTPSPTPTPIGFRSVALTRNQAATADAIQALGSGRLYGAVLSSSAEGARQAFDAASGEIHASAVNAAYEDARIVREGVLDRLRWGGTGLAPIGAAPGAVFASLPARVPAAYAADLPGGPVPGTVPVRVLDPRVVTLWGQGFGSWGTSGGDGNAGTLRRETGGFVAGADATLDGLYRLGVAGGFTSTRLDLPSRASQGGIETGWGALYGSARLDAFEIRAGAAYGGNAYRTSRAVVFPGFAAGESARYGGETGQVFGELGYRIAGALGLPATVEPFVGGAAIRVRTGSFAERGAVDAALLAAGRDHDLAATVLGLRGEAALGTLLGTALPVLVRLRVGWQHAFGEVTPVRGLAFTGAGSTFTIAGVPVDRDAVVAEAGLAVQVSSAATLSLFYAGQAGQRARDDAVRGRLDYRF